MIPAYHRIPELRAAGLKIKQVAHALGVSGSTVSHHARRFGVSFSTKRADAILAALAEGPLTSRALAARMGVKPNAVRARMSQLQSDGLVELCGREKTRTNWAAVWRIVR